MKKAVKTVLIILLVVVLIGAAIGGYFIYRHTTTYIGRRAAEDIAFADSGLSMTEVKKIESEFEKSRYGAWYDVDIDSFGMDYDYIIDARTGEIINSAAELD